MDNEKLDKFKWRLNAYLNQNDYEKFIKEITKISITNDDYIYYLNIIEDVMKEKLMSEQIDGMNLGDRILDSLKEKEKTYTDWLPDLKSAIKRIFEIKLSSDKSYIDADVKSILENFEGRFI